MDNFANARHHDPKKSAKHPCAKKRLLMCALLFVGYVTVASIYVYNSASSTITSDFSERNVNDVTALNPIQVGRVVKPKSTQEIAELLKQTEGTVSIGGGRNSQGGQIAFPGSLHIDMREMNRVLAFDKDQRTIRVQAGIRWRDLQGYIDPHNLSVQIMQTYANFTVGGALSVNAHGRYMGMGPVVLSVRNIRVVLADGSTVDASREQQPEIFYGVIGGYGGLGVIAEVTLALTPNHKVERTSHVLEASRYLDFFKKQVRGKSSIVFHNADLYPPDYDTVRAVSWIRTNKELTVTDRLIPKHDTYTWMPRLAQLPVAMPYGHALRRYILEPWFYSRSAVTWRNHEASYDIAELEPKSRKENTFVLQEYFVPMERFDEFVPKLRKVFQKHGVEVVNVSVRHAIADPGTLLAWARHEMFAFVVYYRQGTTPKAKSKVRTWTREMIDAVISVGGAYYLPYQVHATPAQFEHAYPRSKDFFALKRKLDPKFRFRNVLWSSYYKQDGDLQAQIATLREYHKEESQTLLTVPEWYLVFNPLEYAEHLETGHPSDTFPYVESAREYWSLYKKVVRLTRGMYPPNGEYMTMLRVIGVSTTVEYVIKGAYETVVGRLARWTSDGSPSTEDRLIAQAYRAYSNLIYDKPWYDFEFIPWVTKIWSQSPMFGKNIIRRTERKCAVSMEFIVKAAYAKLIGFAAKTAYGPSKETVTLIVRTSQSQNLKVSEDVTLIRSFDATTHAIAIPRWGPFSKIVPELAAHGVDFVEIAGNDDIAVSVISDELVSLTHAEGQRIFSSKLVAAPNKCRSVLFARVDHLGEILRRLTREGGQIEHIYDY